MITLQFQGTWEGIFLPMVEHCSNRFFTMANTYTNSTPSMEPSGDNVANTVELQYFFYSSKMLCSIFAQCLLFL